MKKLLIFDLNKVLICKNKHRRTSYFLRPNAIDFVKEMMLLYEVAVWTSGKVETMSHAMHTIFGQHEESLLFYWTQKECTRVNFHSPSEEEAPDRASELCVEGEIKKKSKRKDYSANMFKKDLTKVWEKYPQYNQHNTILLDDSPDKVELNPPYTSIFPKKFDVYHLCEQYKLQHLSPTNNSPGPSAEEGKRSKKGVKRGREVSIYQQYSELDVELQRNSPLWRYLTELATYPGHSDEFISRNQYICDQTITQDS